LLQTQIANTDLMLNLSLIRFDLSYMRH